MKKLTISDVAKRAKVSQGTVSAVINGKTNVKPSTRDHILEFAELADIECVLIDGLTSITALKKELRWNESVSWS